MRIRFIFTAAIAIFALALGTHTNAAAKPQLLITWRASDSVAPSAYQGKVLPGVTAPITASVEVISGGSVVDLSSYSVYWYLDDGFVGGGAGKKTVTLNAPGYEEIMTLRVTIPNYPGGLLVGATRIQMAKPHMVLVAPYPGGMFSQSTVQVQAVPYFFKASDLNKLSFQWTVNNQPVATQENPEDLTIDLGGGVSGGYSLSVNLFTKQSDNIFFSDHAGIVLIKTD